MSQMMQPPRGTYDALPEQSRRLHHIEETARRVFGRYGYGEIRTPIFEFTDVFARNVGEATDIVSKEMYVFEDRGGESLSLRPEGTAGVVRAYYSNKMKHQLPLKLMYAGIPVFRYERPQKGRYRQHHQVGIELFGISEPWADVEVIAAGMAFLKELGLTGLRVNINTLGSPADRAAYREKLLAYFEPVKGKLSEESQARLQKNPLRVLDSKQAEDQSFIPDAPKPIDVMSEESQAFYRKVKEGLEVLGIPYDEVPTLVRGLDYYTHTVFEIHSTDLGAQSQVLSGGRYDGLVAQMGNEDVAGVGFGSGMERLEMLIAELSAPKPPVSFVVQGDDARFQAMKLAEQLRESGCEVAVPLGEQSMKAQFKRADKLRAQTVIIIGETELAEGTVTVKDMESGEQKACKMEELVSLLGAC
ncbi:MAG: histidine--tRNA ligase [Alphaproteobacteria bacterium]|nr:histidine--tRNA ligase [Alphaproteobacteria bacterium]MDD9919146.1 histidine--tRNA ligase [Alphaproteobacteria bacterium]